MTSSSGHDARFVGLVHRMEPRAVLRRAWTLEGGISAQVTALEVREPNGDVRRLIVRQHGAGDLKRNPQVAADEFRVLAALRLAGIPVPAPVFLDDSREFFETPVLVVEYMDGETDFTGLDLVGILSQSAAVLASLHNLSIDTLDLPRLPRIECEVTELLSSPHGLHRSIPEIAPLFEALASSPPPPSCSTPRLLHGDFWPGNLLWNAGRLVAVIDWEDAAIGDPLAELANARLETLWAYGHDPMRDFTRLYLHAASINPSALPFWDLVVATRASVRLAAWGLDAATESRFRGLLEVFARKAVDRLSAG